MANKRNEENISHYTILSIAFVCLVVGLPLWWNTTTTYRAYLPYSSITYLAQQQVVIQIPITLVLPQLGKEKDLEYMLNTEKSTLSKLSIIYSLSGRHFNQQEKEIIKNGNSLDEIDIEIEKAAGYVQGSLVFYFLNSCSNKFQKSKMYIGRYRQVYVCIEDGSYHLELVTDTIKNVLVDEAALRKKANTVRNLNESEIDRDSMRALHSAPEYEISFTLLNMEPDKLSVNWDIRNAVQNYLDPFLGRMQEYKDFIVDSQVLYYTNLPIQPTYDNATGQFHLTVADLTNIINPAEARLGSHVSTNPSLNFLVYIPKLDHFPLHILDAKGEIVSTNAFLSPRWGGMVIYNIPQVPTQQDARPMPVQVEMKPIIETFLTQLRLLIGLPNHKHSKNVVFAQSDITATCGWELDAWALEHTVENVVTSVSTLKSLSGLLSKISNIVIKDEIAKEVYDSVNSVEKALDYLRTGNRYRAFFSAKTAIQASEKAFFDPSLLELLYFPEDQKFAIYIPLFLPIGLPVLASLVKTFRWLRAKPEKDKKE